MENDTGKTVLKKEMRKHIYWAPTLYHVLVAGTASKRVESNITIEFGFN